MTVGRADVGLGRKQVLPGSVLSLRYVKSEMLIRLLSRNVKHLCVRQREVEFWGAFWNAGI